MARGHSAARLTAMCMRAAEAVNRSTIPTPRNKLQTIQSLDSAIFLHLRFHPQDPDRHTIQQLFQATCRESLDNAYVTSDRNYGDAVHFGRSIIAYSRAPNVADLVWRNRLGPDFDTHVSGSK